MKDDSELATLFAAFAHPSRIAIMRVLLPYGPSGRKFGELAKVLEISPSTLTHHLREMERSGVLCRKVHGRMTKLCMNLETLNGAIKQLTDICCSENGIAFHQDRENRS